MKISVSRMRAAFTLIELLVVISIIALLAAILFPVFARARENARRTACQSNLKQIGLGMIQYTQDYDEKFPMTFTETTEVAWNAAIYPYVKSAQVYLCPSASNPVTLQQVPASLGVELKASYVGNGDAGGEGNWTDFFGGRPPLSIPNAPWKNQPSSLAMVQNVAQVIVVGEGGANCDNTSATWACGFASYKGNSPDPGFWGMRNHLGTTNFLFVDGHVKAMKPLATIAPVNMWNVDNSTPGGSANQRSVLGAVQTQMQ